MRLVRDFDRPIICGHCASVSFSLCLSLMLFVLCLSLLHFLPQRSTQRGGGGRVQVSRVAAVGTGNRSYIASTASTRNWATGQCNTYINKYIIIYVVHINKYINIIISRSTYEVCSKERVYLVPVYLSESILCPSN